jgi:hypothetical protein
MRKATRNYVIFLLLAALSIFLAVSSFLLWVAFPRGLSAGRALWGVIHKWTGLTLTVLVLIHVFIHRTWLVRMTRGMFTRAPSGQASAGRGRRSAPATVRPIVTGMPDTEGPGTA